MKRLLIIIIIFCFSVNSFTNNIFKIQAMYIYNFTRYVDWPENYKSNDFVIGILGNCAIYDELKTFTDNKKVGNQSISVVCFNSIEEITKCHILYISNSEDFEIYSILKKVNGNNNLIVGDCKGLTEAGAAINFVFIEEKLKFELKSENALKYGLKISSLLCNMALSCN